MKIFISGIGGSGLGPLAELALDAGIEVFGSDVKKSPNTSMLESRGVKISYKQTFDEISKIYAQEKFDWFIHSSAIPSDSEELHFIRQNNIKHSKRDEFLANFVNKNNLQMIAIAGTHGKTTTTSILIWIFRELGISASHSVGSTLSFAPVAHFAEGSKYFIYEADEYDRNFLAYQPRISAIVSLDYDHADIYKTQDDYNSAFREFISNSEKTFMWDSAYKQLFNDNDSNENIVIFGHNSEKNSRNPINLPGEKIRENAKLALEICREIFDEFDEQKVREIIARFPGAGRRFERINTGKNSENLYSDYAHAPAEISATLQKAREIAAKMNVNIFAIYQPHQNARQIEVVREGGYFDSFTDADEISWLPTYLNRLDLLDGAPEVLTPENLINTLNETTKNIAKPAEFNAELIEKIREKLSAGDLVIALGAGPIDDWIRENFSEN